MASFDPTAARVCLRLGALLAVVASAAGAQEAAAPEGGGQGVALSGVAIDAQDDNRFFTRLGGTVRDDV